MPKRNIKLPGQIVAERIKEARLRHGWSQQQLADRVGVKRPTITKIEQGGERAANFSIFDLFQYAAALGVAPVHLLVPHEDDDAVQIAAGRPPLSPGEAREWIRGFHILDDSDPQAWFDNLPRKEREGIQNLAVAAATDEAFRRRLMKIWYPKEADDGDSH